MFGKFEITGAIELLTGLHIGAEDAFAAIGAIDSPVVRDPVSRLPYIPGSSLKGKLRSLLAKEYEAFPSHEFEDQDERIVRLFGKSSQNGGITRPDSRVIFRDALLSNGEELDRYGIAGYTEAKMENGIDPLSAVANPRQIERVVRGAIFPLEIVYNAYEKSTVEEDMKLLAEGLKLLQYDYLGGHGSRGYERVKLSDIDLNCVVGEDEGMEERCREILRQAVL